jgi:chromosome segregation ATPase
MSKKNGKLFSKSLFGYKCKDVHEYIRSIDEEHASEISKAQNEKTALQDKLTEAENKIKAAEERIKQDSINAQKQIAAVKADCDSRVASLNESLDQLKERLEESENRASSYIKLIDSSNIRAEAAETELTVLSATAEDYKAEIEELKHKLAEKEAELKRVSDFEKLAKKLVESNQEEKNGILQSFISLFRKTRK